MLCGSIGGNIWLYQRNSEYYLQLNSIRLDPFGLRSYRSDADALLEQSADRRMVVFFGDSRAADWPAPMVPGVEFVNRGIGAQTSAQVAGRFAAHIAPLHPHGAMRPQYQRDFLHLNAAGYAVLNRELERILNDL
jgi:hypothetical protein